MTPTVQVVTSPEELPGLREEWNEACRSTGSSPYLTFDWVETHVRTHGAGDGMFVAVMRDADGVVAILPLEWRRDPCASHLQPLGGGQAPTYTAIVAERARGLQLLELVGQEARKHVPWDWLVIDRLPEGSPLLEGLPSSSRIRELGVSVTIRLDGGWESYLSGIGRSHRQNVRRRTRQIEKAHRVELRRVGLESGDTGLEEVLEDALEVCRRSWQGSADWGVAISDPGEVEFFKETSRAMARRGMLDLSVFYVDDRPVSFVWGAADPPRSTIASLAFDPELSAVSPGLVHLARVFEDSCERGITEIEFGYEFGEYKRKWSKHGIRLFEVTHYANPPFGRLRHRFSARIKDSVLPRVRRLLGR